MTSVSAPEGESAGTLGHYRLLEPIGTGGMGVVYRARDERLERDVAIKVLRHGRVLDETARRRFRTEALALSRLNHPNIATIHDFDSDAGIDFLVMEYIPGASLDERVQEGMEAGRVLTSDYLVTGILQDASLLHPTALRNARRGPRWLRCSSLTYSRYAHSSRLAIRASPPSVLNGFLTRDTRFACSAHEGDGMRHVSLPLVCVLLFVLSIVAAPAQVQDSQTVVFEGARLVNSDGNAPTDNAAFVVEKGRFTRVGGRGDRPIPAGARRVDLTGKIVMPAFIDAHAHLGYMKDLTIGPQNYTQENLIDHLQRLAYHGVAAGSTWGSDFGEMPFHVRDTLFPNAARFITLGRGITTPSEGTPENMRQAAHVCATADDCRRGVRENAARKLRLVKIWVQDRPAGIPKMGPELYRATIAEAHAHKMKVVVHAFALADVKDLLRAGIDGFAHIPTEVDDELMVLLNDRPDVFFTPTLGTARRMIYSPWLDTPDPLLLEAVTAAQMKRLKDRRDAQTPEVVERGRQNWKRTKQVMRRLIDANVRIALGSDGGGFSGDQFIGWTAHTEIENMVAAGMTPMQALIACTRRAAEVHALDDMGMMAAGKSADFIVLDADPMIDITNTRKISRVFLRGHEVDRAALKAKWTGMVK